MSPIAGVTSNLDACSSKSSASGTQGTPLFFRSKLKPCSRIRQRLKLLVKHGIEVTPDSRFCRRRNNLRFQMEINHDSGSSIVHVIPFDIEPPRLKVFRE